MRIIQLLQTALVAGAVAGAAAACGGAPAAASPGGSAKSGIASATVSCASFPLHGAGEYRDEVQVQVGVSNASAAPGTYRVAVDLTVAKAAGGAGPVMHETLTGRVAANSTTHLSRKVLADGRVQRCAVARLSRS